MCKAISTSREAIQTKPDVYGQVHPDETPAKIRTALEEFDLAVQQRAATNAKAVTATAPPTRHACARKRWGIDSNHPDEYWFDSRIHTLGNHGFGGACHAAMAPISTKLIDILA